MFLRHFWQILNISIFSIWFFLQSVFACTRVGEIAFGAADMDPSLLKHCLSECVCSWWLGFALPAMGPKAPGMLFYHVFDRMGLEIPLFSHCSICSTSIQVPVFVTGRNWFDCSCPVTGVFKPDNLKMNLHAMHSHPTLTINWLARTVGAHTLHKYRFEAWCGKSCPYSDACSM